MLSSFTSERQHGWRILLNLAHYAGIISLPNFYPHNSWKATLHGYYTVAISIISVYHAISVGVAFLRFTIWDMAEVSEQLFITGFPLYLTWISFYLKANLNRLVRIVEFLEEVYEFHGSNKIVIVYKWRETILLMLVFGLQSFGFIGLIFVDPLTKKSESKLATLRRVYHVGFPENTLPAQMYIPFIDWSDPKYYPTVLVLQSIWAFIIFFQNLVGMCYFFTAFCFKVHSDILNEFTRLLGTVHTNDRGKRVFHTNIMKGEYVLGHEKLAEVMEYVRTRNGNYEILRSDFGADGISRTANRCVDVGDGHLRSRLIFEELCVKYEMHYVKQLILYQQKLRYMRNELDSFMTPLWGVITILLTSCICLSLFCLFIPGLLPPTAFSKVLVEFTVFCVVTVVVFVAGEVFSSFNLSWRTALLESHWYECSPRTRKVIPFLLLHNQEWTYLSWKGLVPCSFRFMVSLVKMAYSMSNLLRMRTLRAQR